ncbi:MAG: copper chaperone PCu(A)C [Microthrixaceae bacterium]
MNAPRLANAGIGTVTVLFIALLAACGGPGSESGVAATDPAVGAVPDGVAAVYMTLQSNRDDTLNAVTCGCGARVTLHETADRNGVSMMSAVDRIDLPADTPVQLRPGGAHMMLEDLTEPLEAGSNIELRLSFEHAAAITVEVPVVPLEDLARRIEDR